MLNFRLLHGGADIIMLWGTLDTNSLQNSRPEGRGRAGVLAASVKAEVLVTLLVNTGRFINWPNNPD